MSSSTVAAPIIYLGLDVHKDSVTIAVLPGDATVPTRIDKCPNDFAKLRRVFERHAKDGEIRACYEFVPREHSSGPRERRGSITKAGNTHCRHVLVQAAWAYRLHPKIGPSLAVRQRGQSPAVTLHAWKAQQRLFAMYHRLSLRRGPQIAVGAVARELIGYLWAVMRDLELARETAPLVAA